jgi:hypothetical protein
MEVYCTLSGARDTRGGGGERGSYIALDRSHSRDPD